MNGSAEYKRFRVEDILSYIVHIVPNRAPGYWFVSPAVPAGKAVLTESDIMIN